MKKYERRRFFAGLLCFTLCFTLNFNPLAVIIGAVVDAGVFEKIGIIQDNLIYLMSNPNTTLAAEDDGAATYEFECDASAAIDELMGSGNVTMTDLNNSVGEITDAIGTMNSSMTAQFTVLNGASTSIDHKMDNVNNTLSTLSEQLAAISQQLDAINGNIDDMQHQYRVAHLYSLNNVYSNALWKPYTSEVPYVEDFATVTGKFANVYTGYWDSSVTTLYNPGGQNIRTTRAQEILGYDIIVRSEGILLQKNVEITTQTAAGGLSGNNQSYNTDTTNPTNTIATLWQEYIPENDICWIDAVTVLYKALGQEQLSYQSFMSEDRSITPETSPAFQGLANPIPTVDSTGTHYNGYDFYMFLTRANIISGTQARNGEVTDAEVDYIYWRKALDSGFIPAAAADAAREPIVMSDLYQLATRMMQAYGEPVMNDDELKALLQVYGTNYPIQLGTEIADAWAYLSARGILDFNQYIEGEEAILYNPLISGHVSREQLLTMAMRIRDVDSRTDYKTISVVLDLSDAMKEDYFYPVYDLDITQGGFNASTTFDHSTDGTYEYLLLKNSQVSLGTVGLMTAYSDKSMDSERIIPGAMVSNSTVRTEDGMEWYVISLPIDYTGNVYIAMQIYGDGTVQNETVKFIEIPANVLGGGYFSGYSINGDTATVDTSHPNSYLLFDYKMDNATAFCTDYYRAGRSRVNTNSTASNATVLERLYALGSYIINPIEVKAAVSSMDPSDNSGHFSITITFQKGSETFDENFCNALQYIKDHPEPDISHPNYIQWAGRIPNCGVSISTLCDLANGITLRSNKEDHTTGNGTVTTVTYTVDGMYSDVKAVRDTIVADHPRETNAVTSNSEPDVSDVPDWDTQPTDEEGNVIPSTPVIDDNKEASVAFTVIMQRDSHILLSWTMLVKSGYVTNTLTDKPVDNEGVYSFYTVDGQVIVNTMNYTIQIGSIIYDLMYNDGSGPTLVYIDVDDNNELYFDYRCIMGVNTQKLVRYNEVTEKTEVSLGSGSYALYNITNSGWGNILFDTVPILAYNYPRYNLQTGYNIGVIQHTRYDYGYGDEDIDNSIKDAEGNDTHYWEGADPNFANRMRLTSSTPTNNYVLVIDAEGAENTTEAWLFIYYLREPFLNGFYDDKVSDIVSVNHVNYTIDEKRIEELWGQETAEMIRSSDNFYGNHGNDSLENVLNNLYNINLDEDVLPENWYDRMTAFSVGKLYQLTGRYYISSDYVVRSIRLNENSIASSFDWKGDFVCTNDPGAIYWVDEIGFVYNMPSTNDFTMKDYLEGKYLLPYAMDPRGTTIYNYNFDFYGRVWEWEYYDPSNGHDSSVAGWRHKGNTSIDIPYGHALTSNGTYVDYAGNETIDVSSCIEANQLPFDPETFIPAPVGISTYFAGNACEITTLKELTQTMTDRVQLYYGSTQIKSTASSTGDTRVNFVFVSDDYGKIGLNGMAEAHRVYRTGYRDALIVAPENVSINLNTQGPHEVEIDDLFTNPLEDLFANIGLTRLLNSIDEGASWLIIIAFVILPRIGVILMMILVGLSFLSENKTFRRFTDKVFDPVKFLTFGHRSIDGWSWKTVLFPCTLMFTAFALFLNGNILRILMWVAKWYDTIVRWTRSL